MYRQERTGGHAGLACPLFIAGGCVFFSRGLSGQASESSWRYLFLYFFQKKHYEICKLVFNFVRCYQPFVETGGDEYGILRY